MIAAAANPHLPLLPMSALTTTVAGSLPPSAAVTTTSTAIQSRCDGELKSRVQALFDVLKAVEALASTPTAGANFATLSAGQKRSACAYFYRGLIPGIGVSALTSSSLTEGGWVVCARLPEDTPPYLQRLQFHPRIPGTRYGILHRRIEEIHGRRGCRRRRCASGCRLSRLGLR
jgi:hypothetical protein